MTDRIDLLSSSLDIDVYKGLISCMDNDKLTKDEINILKSLKNEKNRFWGNWPLYAIAAGILNRYNIEKYSGNDFYIKSFIEMWKN